MSVGVRNWPQRVLSSLQAAIRAIKALRGQPDGFVGTDSDGFATVTHLGSGTASATSFLRGDGTWASMSSSGLPTRVKLTADATAITSSTPAAVAGLLFTLTSGTYYTFKFLLLVQTSDATVGPRLGLSLPAFTTFGATVTALFAADGAAATWTGALTVDDDYTTLTDLPAASTSYLVTVEGVILPSGAGDVQIIAAREGATGTITIKQASAGLLFELA